MDVRLTGPFSLGFEVQWNVYAKLCINVLMESILLWKELAVSSMPPTPARLAIECKFAPHIEQQP